MSEHAEEHFAGSNKLFISIWVWLLFLTLIEIGLAYKPMAIHIMLTILLKFERLSLVLTIVPMLVICIVLLFVFFPDSFRSSELRYKFQESPPVAPAAAEEP